MGRKLGGGCALWGGGAGFPSNTMWPGPRPACTPSFILIRPIVWPQCTNITDRQDRTDDRQRTDSIGRTVLQTVAQKLTETKSQLIQYWNVLNELRFLNLWQFWFISSVFDTFVFESENGVLVLHLKDRFGSFVIRVAIIATANSPRIWRLLPRLNREFSDFWPRKITALRTIWYFTRTSALGELGYTSWLPEGVS